MKNLKESLLELGSLDCKCKVSTGLVKEMEIYGLVPTYLKTLMLPLGQAIVCSDRVLMSINNIYVRFPIFQTISKCNEEKVLLENLYVPSLFFNENRSIQQWYQAYYQRGNVDYLRKISNLRTSSILEVEGKWYYKISSKNWFFTSDSPIRAVADDFLVVCRRINSVTGIMVYEIYRPEDLVITFTKENLNPFGI